MTVSGLRSLVGDSPTHVARQAAVLFAVSGLSAVAALPTETHHTGVLAAVAAADLGTSIVAWLLPWERWNARLPALLALPGFAVLALSTWVFGGFAAGTGPFFVLIFAWLGLHQPIWIILANVPPAIVAYVVPLVVVDAPAPVLASAVVLVPVSVCVGALIAAQATRLREERDNASRMGRWRSALMATLAHDFRSPLTTVEGTLKLLAGVPGLAPERRAALLESALQQTARLNRLIAGLLDVERVEQGKLQLDKSDIDLRKAIHTATALVAPDADLQVDMEAGLRVTADPDRLEQILVNLTANALRHGKPPILITAHREDHRVNIEVRDHGQGVPAHLEGRLFGRLEGDHGQSDSVGLGMWIVRLLTEAHGGTVTYEPADPGARFRVVLPAE